MEIQLTQGKVAQISDRHSHLAKYRWRAQKGHAGRIFYAIRSLGGGKVIALHREIMGLSPGDPMCVDHIDGDGLNCRDENMRVVTRAVNTRNISDAPVSKKSGLPLGVSWHKNRNGFVAHVRIDKKQTHLGIFKTLEEAMAARLKAEAEVYGIQPRREWAHKPLDGLAV